MTGLIQTSGRRLRTWLRRIRFRARWARRDAVRLHLGCGAEYWPGYVNIDADPAAHSDVCMDFMDIGAGFPQGSVVEVAMIHSLSYLRLWQARDLLASLHGLMTPGGTLIVEFPDAVKCARQVIDSGEDEARYLEAIRGLYAFDLEAIHNRAAFTPYAFGWSASYMKLELTRAGFRDVRESAPRTHGQRLWRDSRVEAVK